MFLRNSVRWINEKTQNAITRLSLHPTTFFLPEEEIFKQLIRKSDTIKSLKVILDELDQQYESVILLGASVSPDLAQSMQAHQAKAKRITDRISQKFNAHLKRKEESTIGRIRKIKDQVAPNGHLQERYDNFLTIYKYTGLTIFDTLLTYQQAFGKEFLVLSMTNE